VSRPLTPRPADASDVPQLVADKLARRCWSVARDDLRQEAEAAAIHMRTMYNPEKGDLRGYLYRGIARHLTNYMWEAGSPVSYKHRRNELRATIAVDADKAAGIADPTLDLEAEVARARWRVRVMDRVVELAGADAELAAPCLFEAGTPLAVAKAMRVPLLQVLDALARVRDLIGDDPVMRQLYTEMP
jgi:hypothetical protein